MLFVGKAESSHAGLPVPIIAGVVVAIVVVAAIILIILVIIIIRRRRRLVKTGTFKSFIPSNGDFSPLHVLIRDN